MSMNPPSPDTDDFKQREQRTWTAAAPGWRRHDERMVQATAPVTTRMLELLSPTPGGQILDVASGTGEPALSIAEAVGPSGRVIAVDFVDEMLTVAREKAALRGLANIEFRHVDGEDLDIPETTFDAVSNRWGLMFMPDPVGALRRALGLLESDGRIAVACWAGPERNPWVSLPMKAIRQRLGMEPPPPGTPGIFAFASAERLQHVLEEAGFVDVRVEPVDVLMAEFDTGAEFFGFLRDVAGPVATLFNELSEDEQADVSAEIAQAVTGPDGHVRLPGVTWVAVGTKP